MSSAITAVVVGGVISKQQAGKAQRASDASRAQQLGIEERRATRAEAAYAPYREAGGRALSQLEQMMSGEYDITQTPGYQFRLEEGYKGLERSQAGRRLGGRAAKEAMRYGQEYASDEYGKEFGRLRSMAGMGLAGTGQETQLASTGAGRSMSTEAQYGTQQIGLEEAKGEGYQQTIQNLWTAYNQ